MVEILELATEIAMGRDESKSNGWPPSGFAKDIALLSLLYAPLYLSDFLLIAATARKEVLLIDYAAKALPLLMLFFMPSFRPIVRQAMFSRPDWRWTIVLVPVCIVAIPALLLLELFLARSLPNIQLFDFPSFKGEDWYIFDLTLGLTLNSISEELIGRGIFAAILLRRGHGVGFVILVSALVFAGAHWSKGLANILVAAIDGAIYMGVYLKTRSIWPGVVVHTTQNVVVFA